MPAQRYEAEELDDATLDYLQTVRDRKGRGCPGLFLKQKDCGLWGDNLLLWGMIGGLVFMVITLGCTIGSAGNPTSSAMLQTAGILLGGWLSIAYVRAVVARNRQDYLGHFKFVDPVYLWHADGTGVWVTTIERAREATYSDNRDQQGKYTFTNVRIKLKNEAVDLPIYSRKKAAEVVAFLNLLYFLRDLPAEERGYAALRALDDNDPDDLCDADDDELEMAAEDAMREQDEIVEAGVVDGPPEPRQIRTMTGWWRYPVIVAAGVLVFVLFYQVDKRMRDGALWNRVKNDRPPVIRGYLADKRNTRNREEAFKKLESFHEQAASGILGRFGGNADLKTGVAAVTRALSRQIDPVVTLGFKELPAPAGQQRVPMPGAAWQLGERQKTAIRDISMHLQPRIGDELAGFAQAPDGETPMVEIGYVVTRPDPAQPYKVDWVLTFRGKEGDKPVVYRFETQVHAVGVPDEEQRRAFDALVQRVRSDLP